MRALAMGVAAGCIGAAAWIVTSQLTGHTIGFLAVGVGVLAGAGVAAGSRQATSMTGITASMIAIGAIAFSRASAAWISGPPPRPTEEFIISYLADEVVVDRVQRGLALDYPPGANPAFPIRQKDYPADVWAEASRQWDALDEASRADFERKASSVRSTTVASAGIRGLAPIDALWALIAVAAAYRLAIRHGRFTLPETTPQLEGARAPATGAVFNALPQEDGAEADTWSESA